MGLPDYAGWRAAHRSSEAWLLDRHGEVLQSLRLDPRVRRLPWVELDEISPVLVQAVVATEDHRYYGHHGVDWLAAGAALRDGLVGRGWRGASTISMQLAAKLDPELAGTAPGSRRAGAKLRQVLAALVLERRWSKREILEAYLNGATYRGELAGIAAASRGLFGHAPATLQPAEAWLLAASLRAPNASPARVARRACRAGQLEPAACAELTSLAQSALAAPRAIPPDADAAPHLARRLLKLPGERVRSTLDASLQRAAQEVLSAQLDALGVRSVRDGAVLVVDNQSGDVLAYAGSAGRDSRAPAIDGVMARRQAGSTLKPFLYALAIESRLLTAASLVDDSPAGIDTGAGLYVPRNYDRRFRGTVSLRTALASSLNVPAVRTVSIVGLPRLHAQLGRLGYAGLNPDPEFYGSSLALGSAEVTLAEQAAAYRALANGGARGALRLRLDESLPKPAAVIDARAAWIVADILADREARAPAFGYENPLSTPVWAAVKTGTSVDMRDNWCIGFTRRHTIAVWVGNFEGDSMRDVSGVSGAAPAWFALVRLLQQQEGEAPPPPPEGVLASTVEFVPAVEPRRREWFLAGTEVTRVARAEDAARRPRIVAPEHGLVVALDPDIPSARQRLPLLADSSEAGLAFTVDGKVIGAAAGGTTWRPTPGRHRIALTDKRGAVLDEVEVSVRGGTAGAR
ncbi:MAG: penicillin-binding protein 1C [Gammaproteobacteria bacterium]|nr:penicillin-binding protein 1C [Gammaproteobacteria bacterium]